MFVVICFLVTSCFVITKSMNFENTEDWKETENTLVKIRAVIINCDPEEEGTSTDSETTRFQREELYKHNALHDCKKKLALAVKIFSDPERTPLDEYIPIQHVLGPNRKRLRILNPYVLRLRRQPPLESYKIHRMEAIKGIILDDSDPLENLKTGKQKRESYANKYRQSASISSLITDHEKRFKCANDASEIQQPVSRDHGESKREAKVYNDYVSLPHDENLFYYPTDMQNEQEPVLDNMATKTVLKDNRYKAEESQGNDVIGERDTSKKIHKVLEKVDSYKVNNFGDKTKHNKRIPDRSYENVNRGLNSEKYFMLYKFDDPDVLFSSQVQLFEKLSTPEGRTTWNDITKGSSASISTFNPEWSNQDMNIRYHSNKWLLREEFTLSNKDLRLLQKINKENDDSESDQLHSDMSEDILIVPKDDIIIMESNIDNVNKRENNVASTNSSDTGRRIANSQIAIRVSRAIMSPDLTIVSENGHQYLRLPYQKKHEAQIDVEAVADDNESIIIGAEGRLTSIVSDTSRKLRSTLDVRATNTGLAAARFRLIVRDCNPDLPNVINGESSDGIETEPRTIPPQHTHTYRLTIPLQIPVEDVHCTVALVNDDNKSIAVRDARLRKDDRCFCIWHCDCVCFGENPKLPCQDMSATQRVAAGFLAQENIRHARSVCYPDVLTINLCVIVVGVILALLFLGLLKACLGLFLRCIGSFGLYLILQIPRQLDHYYEAGLKCRKVEYDKEGWPVHPDTKQRTVRLISLPMEFILNIIFFIILPCVMLWSALRKLSSQCRTNKDKSRFGIKTNDFKKCFSSHDVQREKRSEQDNDKNGCCPFLATASVNKTI